MKPVRIFRHIACEGPGYLGQVLTRHEIPFDMICIDRGTAVPQTLEDVSGLVFMGGPMSVNDDLPWIADEIALIQAARDRQLPVLGHCLGAQLIAKALGGKVFPNNYKEIGWHDVTIDDSPAARAWFGRDGQFAAFHWHGETYTLPAGAQCLLRSQHCGQQAFALDNILGLQCHVEVMADMVQDWADLYRQELRPEDSPAIQTREQMTQNLAQRIIQLQTVADGLYERWLERLTR